MTGRDFDEWYTTAGRAFPEMMSWMNNLAEGEETLALWKKAFERTKFSYAKVAVDAMLRGDIPRPEYGWSDMPKLINQYARELVNAELNTPSSADEGKRINCVYCRDNLSGYCFVWNPFFLLNCRTRLLDPEEVPDLAALDSLFRLYRKHKARTTGPIGGLSVPTICCCNGRMATIKREDFLEKGSPVTTLLFDPQRFFPYHHGELEPMRKWLAKLMARLEDERQERMIWKP